MSSRPHYLMTEIDVTETAPEERAAAARTVARYAATQDNPQGVARELLEMLDLMPDPPRARPVRRTGRCPGCGARTYHRRTQGGPRHLCAACNKTAPAAGEKGGAE